jgi:hypothetical protein
MTKDAAQHSMRIFYEAVSVALKNSNLQQRGKNDSAIPAICQDWNNNWPFDPDAMYALHGSRYRENGRRKKY